MSLSVYYSCTAVGAYGIWWVVEPSLHGLDLVACLIGLMADRLAV